MTGGDIERLKARLTKASAQLPNVREKRMFGCDALFHGDAIFALVWKHGRIALRLGEATAYEELMAHEGRPRGARVRG